MAAPNYEQIQSFDHVTEQLKQAAIDEFLSEVDETMRLDDVLEVATRIAEKFAFLGAELGAQWYDLCTQLAGIEAEPAEIQEPDPDGLRAKAESTVKASQKPFVETFEYYMQNVINDSIRKTGDANLWRDYMRGLSPGKWARVPVGDTCAWCLMLASQGAWYLTEESAVGDGDHYHNGCNCKAVYHADAESINGYSGKLGKYKAMYYSAENIREAAESGKEPYPEELAMRIAKAEAMHGAREAAKKAEAEANGETYVEQQWTQYNVDLIIMRDKYGLK